MAWRAWAATRTAGEPPRSSGEDTAAAFLPAEDWSVKDPTILKWVRRAA